MPKQPDRLLTYNEAAELIGLKVDTIRRRKCGTDELSRIMLGKRVMFSFNDVQAFIARKLRKAQQDQNRAQYAVMASKEKIQRAVLRVIDGYKERGR
jgi:excisionase family DNA binding protein